MPLKLISIITLIAFHLPSHAYDFYLNDNDSFRDYSLDSSLISLLANNPPVTIHVPDSLYYTNFFDEKVLDFLSLYLSFNGDLTQLSFTSPSNQTAVDPINAMARTNYSNAAKLAQHCINLLSLSPSPSQLHNLAFIIEQLYITSLFDHLHSYLSLIEYFLHLTNDSTSIPNATNFIINYKPQNPDFFQAYPTITSTRYHSHYQDALANKFNQLFQVTHLQCPSNLNQITPVAIIVESNLYKRIQDKIQRYIQDLSYENYSPILLLFPVDDPYSFSTALQFKKLLHQLHSQQHISGAVLFGQLPVAYYNTSNQSDQFAPSDIFFQDLSSPDSSWNWVHPEDSFSYLDTNSAYNPHHLDIWISRIAFSYFPYGYSSSPYKYSESHYISAYLDKNHAYRSGYYHLADRTTLNTFSQKEFQPYLRQLNSTPFLSNLIQESLLQDTPPEGTLDLFSSIIQIPSILLLVHSHSSPNCHTFDQNQHICTTDFLTLPINAIFAILHACSTADYLEKMYLAGAYLFSPNSQVLSTFAYTFPSNSEQYSLYLLQGLLLELSLGDAYLNAWNYHTFTTDYDWAKHYAFAYTLLGDPTLSIPHQYSHSHN